MLDSVRSLSEGFALATGLVASATDLRSRRIPNVLTLGSSVAAVAFWIWNSGLAGVATSVGGWAVGCALFLPWFVLGGMGAGDVKLLAALGAWLGPADAAWLALYSGIAGGIFGLLVALATGYVGQSVRNLWGLLMFWRVAGVRPLPELTLATAKGPRLPYAIPITAGVVVVLWLR
jgi:prepilin peptidase CpaA